MTFRFLRSFDRAFKRLSERRRDDVRAAIEALLRFHETGRRTEGIGLKKLRKDFWEIRSDIATRVLFTMNDDCTTFVIVGNHDEIRRFLKGA